MVKIIVCAILVLLIIATVIDLIKTRKLNRKKFGSDFMLDTITKGTPKNPSVFEPEDANKKNGFIIKTKFKK